MIDPAALQMVLGVLTGWQLLGEVGSRGTQRLFVTHVTLESKSGKSATMGLVINDWVDV